MCPGTNKTDRRECGENVVSIMSRKNEGVLSSDERVLQAEGSLLQKYRLTDNEYDALSAIGLIGARLIAVANVKDQSCNPIPSRKLQSFHDKFLDYNNGAAGWASTDHLVQP